MKNQEFIVPKGSNTNVLVRPRMRTDVDGATSGESVAFRMDRTPSASTGSVRARGLLSSNNLTGNDADATPKGEVFIGVGSPAANSTSIFTKNNKVVLSKITSITSADPNANGTAIPTGSARAIGQFKFSTAALSNLKNGVNKFTLSGVVFNVNATNVDLDGSSFKVYNKLDSTVTSSCTALSSLSTSSSLVIGCYNLQSGSVNTQIDPGTDATFVLQVDVTNAKANASNTSTLQVSLQNFTNIAAAAISSSDSHLIWVDKDNATVVVGQVFLWLEYPDTSVNGTSYNS